MDKLRQKISRTGTLYPHWDANNSQVLASTSALKIETFVFQMLQLFSFQFVKVLQLLNVVPGACETVCLVNLFSYHLFLVLQYFSIVIWEAAG